MTITHYYHMTLFTLTTAKSFYKKDQAEKLEKLGFKFTEHRSGIPFSYYRERSQVCIKSDRVEIKIDTLNELLALAKEYGDLVIIADEDQPTIVIGDLVIIAEEDQPNIVIYDDNLE